MAIVAQRLSVIRPSPTVALNAKAMDGVSFSRPE